MAAWRAMRAYGTCRNSAMTNAAAPMTGGMIWPPVDAVASTAAANGGRKPVRFMSGIVSQPSTMTLATAEPEMVPKRLEETTEIFPGPPRAPPVTARAKSMKNCPVPDFSRKAPKTTKRITYVADTATGIPQIPSVVR
jgi:hypothetical protein